MTDKQRPHKAQNSVQETVYSFSVLPEQDNQRLDKFLAEQLQAVFASRERIQGIIASGGVFVDGHCVQKPAARLDVNQTVNITIPEATPIAIEAEEIPLDIVYEDAEMLVVNKSAGMLTHPNGRVQTGTLVNALLWRCGQSLSGINGQLRPGIVHRLDRDTSGLLMVAKTDCAHLSLSAQLKAKTVKRTYQAIVQGVPADETGSINLPIGRHPVVRDKMQILDPPKGRPAITHWKVLQKLGNRFALLELQLETGRTHQIRVHLAETGHPLVGDPQYGTGLEKILKLKTTGQLLQAYQLVFQHPVSNDTLCFEIPQDPALTTAWYYLSELT
ncbi:MAG: RluA family pseudouridine synthase [Cyanobacteria bacterium P01_H01_bin.74]